MNAVATRPATPMSERGRTTNRLAIEAKAALEAYRAARAEAADPGDPAVAGLLRDYQERSRLAVEAVEGVAASAIRRVAPSLGLHEREDFMQSLRVEALEMIDYFDPERGAFTTLCDRRFRQYAPRRLREIRHVIHVPNGHFAAEPRPHAAEARRASRARASGGDVNDEVLSALPSRAGDDAEDADEIRARVDGILRVLPLRESQVLAMRFGLARDGLASRVAVGDAIGVTKERVRQIEARALRLAARLGGDTLQGPPPCLYQKEFALS
jgi:RNA polymerase sigma factor (sigma-70 family)